VEIGGGAVIICSSEWCAQVVNKAILQFKPCLQSEVVGLDTTLDLDRYTAMLQKWNNRTPESNAKNTT
jgi:hypothetical protein